jgi:hypothetical protein
MLFHAGVFVIHGEKGDAVGDSIKGRGLRRTVCRRGHPAMQSRCWKSPVVDKSGLLSEGLREPRMARPSPDSAMGR